VSVRTGPRTRTRITAYYGILRRVSAYRITTVTTTVLPEDLVFGSTSDDRRLAMIYLYMINHCDDRD
jgi:hypothetical protein